MKTLSEFMKTVATVNEELSATEKREVDSWPQSHRRNIGFSDHVFGGPDNHRVTIPLEHPPVEAPHEIVSHLANHGINVTHESYAAGHGIDKHNRQVKIGKSLDKTNAPEHIKNIFRSDPQRSFKDHNDLQVVMSRHHHDVAGMTSEGHPWQSSCMNYRTGINKKYLPKDVEHGTHVAYLTHAGDHEVKAPIARIALKPFTSQEGHTILRPETKTYGAENTAFTHTTNKFAEHHFSVKDPIYKKNENLYNDSASDVVIGNIDKAISSHDRDIQHAATEHPALTPHHIDKLLDHKDPYIRGNVIRHDNASPENINKALDDKHADVRINAVKNKNATPENIDKAMNLNGPLDEYVHERALRYSPHVTSEHITKALNHAGDVSNPFEITSALHTAAISHKNATPEHIDHVISNPKKYSLDTKKAAFHPKSNATPENIRKALTTGDHQEIQDQAASHPNIHPEDLNEILGKDFSDHIRTAALRNPKITPEHIDKALDDKTNKSVRFNAIRHDKANEDNIHKALSDVSDDVRARAAQHQNATPKNIDKALNDEDGYIRVIAAGHPNASKENLDKALNMNNRQIRFAAASNKNSTEEHRKKYLDIYGEKY